MLTHQKETKKTLGCWQRRNATGVYILAMRCYFSHFISFLNDLFITHEALLLQLCRDEFKQLGIRNTCSLKSFWMLSYNNIKSILYTTTSLKTRKLKPLLTGGRCSGVIYRLKCKIGTSNSSRCLQVVAIRRWSLAKIWLKPILRIFPFFAAKLGHFIINIFNIYNKTLKLNSKNRKTKKKVL